MESIQSKFTKVMLRLVNVKRMWELTGDDLKKHIEEKQSSERPEPSNKIQNKFKISKEDISGYRCYVMKPLKNARQKHILYLHGGGGVYEISSLHWDFLEKIIDSLQCTITIPIYPLAPKHQHQEVFDMLVPIYKQIISEVKFEDVVIMGDGSGGGMSLALAELLKEKSLPQPGNIVLISPMLDMSFTNPEICEVEKLDPVSAVPALNEIMNWYSGDKGLKYFLISPIYGNIKDLGKISLFIGTYDILYPDTKKLKKMAEEKGIKIDFYEYPFMINVWPLFSFPESKKATKQIIEIIKSS